MQIQQGTVSFSHGSKYFLRELNSHFSKHLAEKTLLESQSGFRAERGTTAIIFIYRHTLEKGREEQKPIGMGFADLENAFDTVHRQMLFAVLERIGCHSRFLALISTLQSGNTATVRVSCEM